MILSSIIDNPVVMLVVLIIFFGLLALVVFLLRKYIKAFRSDEKRVDRETAAKEDLDRILVPIKDEKTKEEMEKFQKHEEESKKK